MSGAGKMGDRGGGREGRGKSLNKIKKLKHAVENNKKFSEKPGNERPKFSIPPPPLLAPRESIDFLDCSASLCSRQFTSDVNSVIRRARAEGIGAIIIPLSDSTQIEENLKFISNYRGELYFTCGLTPDILRKNEKFSESRLENMKDIFLQGNCVGMEFGLDYTRETATHAQQLRLFLSQLEIAGKIRLPVIWRVKNAYKQVIENYQEYCKELKAKHEEAGGEAGELYFPRVAIHNFSGPEEELREYLAAGFYILLNGSICDVRAVQKGSTTATAEGDEKSSAAPTEAPAAVESSAEFELIGSGLPLFRLIRAGLLPLDRLLLSTDSPGFTPQNIPDFHIRTSRNEPVNLPFLFQILQSAYNKKPSAEEMKKKILQNTETFFQFNILTEEEMKSQKMEEENPINSGPGGGKKEKEAVAPSQGKKKEKRGGGKNNQTVEESSSESESEESDSEDSDKGIPLLLPQSRRNRRQQEDEEEEKPAGKKRGGKTAKAGGNQKNSAQPKNVGGKQKGRVKHDSDEELDGLDEQMAKELQEMEIQGKSQAIKKPAGPSTSASSSNSIQLPMAQDEFFTFACKRCRRPVFSQAFLLAHENSEGRGLKDYSNCETLFVDANCMGGEERKRDGGDSEEEENSSEASDSDDQGNSGGNAGNSSTRLECPCGSKLGRICDPGSLVPCSCGRHCSSVVSRYSLLQRRRLDFLPTVAGDHLKAPRSLEAEYELLEASRLEQEEINRLARKESDRLKKVNKKVKKQLKDDQRGNFTEFRNKSLVSSKQKKKEEK